MQLFYQLSLRSIQERYRGSMFGVLLSVITPLCMLAVYTFVFTVVFKARWNMEIESGFGSYAIMLFSGIILHGFFMESLSQSATVITNNPNYVKKVIFPLELLVPSLMSGQVFQYIIGLFILLGAMLFIWPSMSYHALLIPFVLAPFFLFTLGVGYFVAALGVYFRDIAHFIGILGSVLLFTSTILFPADRVPEEFRLLLYLNPLSYVVDTFRGCVMFHTLPSLLPFSLYTAIGITTCITGAWLFKRMKRGFADVI